jgi:response regulator RpfG family c-di-GMP phosphodiesterase
MSEKILCIDDDANILAAYERNLRRRFAIDTAVGSEAGLSKIREKGPYAVVVADMKMPVMNGIELLAQIRKLVPATVRIMLTGNADQQTAIEAVNKGYIFRFMTKPCSPEMLALALDAGLEQYRLVTAERELLEKTLSGSVKILSEILSLVEPQIFGRSQMLREYMRTLAPALKIDQVWELEVAAMLCQIGYVTIPAVIIQKDRGGLALTAAEKLVLTRIPEIGSKLLANIPRLESVARSVLYQNKYFDGSGFPQDAVAGSDIPFAARMLRILSDLIQQEITGTSKEEALEKMQKRPGSYDPAIINAALATLVQNPRSKASGHALKVKDLVTGQILLSAVETMEGVLIVPAGTEISPMLLAKLNNFAELSGVKEPIYVSK